MHLNFGCGGHYPFIGENAMNESIPVLKFIMNPVKLVTYTNLLLIVIIIPLLLYTVIGYYFGWHKISQDAIVFVAVFISVWLGLFVVGFIGARTWKVWGRVATFFAWLPMIFAFPLGTIMGGWIIYSLFRKPVSASE